jgi:phosphomevalonate kinase|tara:strand:+ start:750 stop:998 length:249 start_codon:yes stop_codon:yes gene_type:complete
MTDQRREEHAKRLLNDELFNEAFDTLKTDLMERWHNSGSNESEARESLWLAIRLLDKVRGHVESIVETGHMAKILEKQHPFI